MSGKSLGRRLFARAAVGVPTALKLAQNHAIPSVARSLTPSRGMDSTAQQSFASKVWAAIREASQSSEEREARQYSKRTMMGGLDPDLSVLNSMSLQRRVQIQIDRDLAARDRSRSLRHTIIRSLGGNPEDFE